MSLIDADELLYRLEKIKEKFLDEGNYIAMCIAKTVIKMLKTEGTIPTIDAEPVRHGRWIPRGDDDSDAGMYKCSECGDERYFGEEVLTSEEAATYARYCPNCGAKMDAKGEEE